MSKYNSIKVLLKKNQYSRFIQECGVLQLYDTDKKFEMAIVGDKGYFITHRYFISLLSDSKQQKFLYLL